MEKRPITAKLLGAFSKIALILCVLGSGVFAKNMFEWRCVIRPGEKFTNATSLTQFETFLGEIKKKDYNGVIFGGSQMDRLHNHKAQTKSRLQQMLAKAAQLEIAIIPMSNGQKSPNVLDPNFQEAFANKGTPFVVSGNTATVQVAPLTIKDPGFEVPFGTNWKGGQFKQDLTEKRSGNASLRIDNPAKGSAFYQSIKVTPHRTYKLFVWVKLSQDVSFYKNLGFSVLAGSQILLKKRDGNRNNINNSKKGGAWFVHSDEFNSKTYTTVRLRIMATENGSSTGTMWFDDVKVQEVGLYNTVLRNTLPLVVKSASGDKVYKEGTDYTVGNQKLDIPSGSSIKGGDKLHVDWFTLATPNTKTSPMAFCSNDAWDVVDRQIKTEDDWFQTPPARLMKYSEWRVAGWDPACINQFQIAQNGCGSYYGHVIKTTEGMLRAANSNREVLIFNDDLDPYHNALKEHQSVNGGSFGSWDGLSEDMIILNWNTKSRKNSLAFFAGINPTDWPGYGVKKTRQRQIISAGSWGTGIWGEWLTALENLEKEGLPDGSVIGVAFHQYSGNYDNVPAMADFYKKAGRWGTGPIQFAKAGTRQEGRAAVAPSASLSSVRTSAGNQCFRFVVPKSDHVELTVYNLRGQMVGRILNESMAAGTYERDLDVSRLPAGVYMVRLTVSGESGRQSLSQKVLVF